ncbi:hypothetical protein GCM10020220_027880 [Nonomuraea rubra]
MKVTARCTPEKYRPNAAPPVLVGEAVGARVQGHGGGHQRGRDERAGAAGPFGQDAGQGERRDGGQQQDAADRARHGVPRRLPLAPVERAEAGAAEHLAQDRPHGGVVVLATADRVAQLHLVRARHADAVVGGDGLAQPRVEGADLGEHLGGDRQHGRVQFERRPVGGHPPAVHLQGAVLGGQALRDQRLGQQDAAQGADLRVVPQDPHRVRHRVGVESDVGVEEEQDLPGGVLGAEVAGGGRAAVDRGPYDLGAHGRGHPRRVLGAAVVHHDDLDVRVGLRSHRVQAEP